ncbi:MAG: rhomboid family intramembrane serine protease [Sphingobacteriia bacterium]|nr:rhomboid family intramembrane serine protease [Sphingobacteriia bacterium]
MSYQHYSPQGFSLLPPVVKNLLILNGLFFLATIALQQAFAFDITSYLGLRYPGSQAFAPYQFITYMFLHGGVSHIIFNMFALWMFGYMLENIWGSKRFLIYYLITGIGAALVHYAVFYFEINPMITYLNDIIENPSVPAIMEFRSSIQGTISPYAGELHLSYLEFLKVTKSLVVHPDSQALIESARGFIIDYKQYMLNRPNVIGASGAVFGILLAFGMLFPNVLLYVYFFFPIKAKWFVILYGLLELYLGFTQSQSNVAHFAHLGGMIFGFFLIKYWKHKRIY